VAGYPDLLFKSFYFFEKMLLGYQLTLLPSETATLTLTFLHISPYYFGMKIKKPHLNRT
jgi:hypothetical protein